MAEEKEKQPTVQDLLAEGKVEEAEALARNVEAVKDRIAALKAVAEAHGAGPKADDLLAHIEQLEALK